MNHPTSHQPQGGADNPLHGWSQRLGLSYEEYEALMAVGNTLNESRQETQPPLSPDIAAGFVC